MNSRRVGSTLYADRLPPFRPTEILSQTSAKDAFQLVSGCDFQLIVAAVLRAFVEAPANEMRSVTKPRALHVIVRDFANALRTQRLPAQILAAIPPASASRHPLPLHRLGPIAPR